MDFFSTAGIVPHLDLVCNQTVAQSLYEHVGY